MSAKAAAERALGMEIDAETQGLGQLALAYIHLLLGNLDAALMQAQKTLEETRQNEIMQLTGRSQRLLGQIQAARGFTDEADISFVEALQVFKQRGLRLDYARTLQKYGSSLLQRRLLKASVPNDQLPIDDTIYQKGLGYLREARDIFEVCGASNDKLVEWILLSTP